jgi:hypothetical protein
MLRVVLLNALMLNAIMLNFIILNVILLNVVILNVFILNVFILNVVMLNVIKPNSMAPSLFACGTKLWKQNVYEIDLRLHFKCLTCKDMLFCSKCYSQREHSHQGQMLYNLLCLLMSEIYEC